MKSATPTVSAKMSNQESLNAIDVSFAIDLPEPTKTQIQRWASHTLTAEQCAGDLAIRVVDRAEGQALNHDFRGKDYPTNVLAFPTELHPQLPLAYLGDIAICAPVVEAEARQQGKPLLDHWAHLVTHGVLHLLGYDHVNGEDADRMETKETELLAQLNIPNPY